MLFRSIGSQWDLTGGIQVRTALFRTDKINQRIADSITGVTVLAGKRRVEGLELQVNGTLTKGLAAILDAAVGGSHGPESNLDANGVQHILQSQQLFDELSGDTWPQKHGSHHCIKQILDLCHALFTTGQLTVYALIPFGTNRFVYSQFCLH